MTSCLNIIKMHLAGNKDYILMDEGVIFIRELAGAGVVIVVDSVLRLVYLFPRKAFVHPVPTPFSSAMSTTPVAVCALLLTFLGVSISQVPMNMCKST